MILALAAAVTLVAASAGTAMGAGLIRVAVVEQARVVEIRGTDVEVTELGRCDRCRPNGTWRMDLVRAVPAPGGVDVEGVRATGFRLTSERLLRVNGRDYPAPLDLLRSGDTLTLVNELPLEDYLA